MQLSAISQRHAATCPSLERATAAGIAAAFFFPADLELNLRAECFSPRILRTIEWAGGNIESFEKAAEAVTRFLGVAISAEGVRSITERLGRERAALRDTEVTSFNDGDLHAKYSEPPAVAAVFLDGGRLQVRAADSGPGVHDPAWTESKVADLVTYTDVRPAGDPQPTPPSKFLEQPKVVKLAQQMSTRGSKGTAKPAAKNPPGAKKAPPDRPRPKVRTVVATTGSCAEFGPMVAAEATRRGFFGAKKKAILGDGGPWIWGIADFYFVGFVQILDFVHLLTHLYAAAQAAHKNRPKQAWRVYRRLIELAWGGDVTRVKQTLRRHSERLGVPPPDASDEDPRKILARAVEYVETNRHRMDYPRCRRQGLPISSAPVESLIKEVNKRVKGSEKFWTRAGVEAVLQVRAAFLSDDGRDEEYWSKRPLGRAAGSGLRGRRKRRA